MGSIRAFALAVGALLALLIATAAPALAGTGITSPTSGQSVTVGEAVQMSATTPGGVCSPSLTVTTPDKATITVATASPDPLCGSAKLSGSYTPDKPGTYTVAVVDSHGGSVYSVTWTAATPPTTAAPETSTPAAAATAGASATPTASQTPTKTVDLGRQTPKPSPSPTTSSATSSTARPEALTVITIPTATLTSAAPATPGAVGAPETKPEASATPTPGPVVSPTPTAFPAVSATPTTVEYEPVSDESGVGSAFGALAATVGTVLGLICLVVLIASSRRDRGRHGDSLD